MSDLQMPANDIIAAFQAGVGTRQRNQDLADAREQRSLQKMILEHQLKALKIDDALHARSVAMQNAQILEGTPEADLTPAMTQGGILPSQNLSALVTPTAAPGGNIVNGQPVTQPSPAATAAPVPARVTPLPGVQAPTRMAAIQIPGLPSVDGSPEVPGVSVRPRTLEEMIRAQQATKLMEPVKLGEGETLTIPGTGQVLARGGDKQPNDDFTVNFLRPALAIAEQTKGAPLTPQEHQRVATSTLHLYSEAKSTKDPEAAALLNQIRELQIQQLQAGMGGGKEIEIAPNSQNFKIAQDLAYGKLTYADFNKLYPNLRGGAGAALKRAIYSKARDLNPNFNPSQFEIGFKFASSPKVQQQLASLDNVTQAIPDLINISDGASRTGVTALNGLVNKAGYEIGGKHYSNFKVAQKAFADELSGALGFGSATDMSRQMGVDMTDPNLSPENFRDAIQTVVLPFIERKRDTMLKGMGAYGQSSPYAPANAGGKGGGPGVNPFRK